MRGGNGHATALLRLELRRVGVFNSRLLQELLPKLARKHGFDRIRYEIERYEAPSHSLQLDDFIDGIDLTDAREVSKQFDGSYKLNIYVEPVSDGWSNGFKFGLTYQSPYGIIANASLATPTQFIDQDRNILEARLGLNGQQLLSLAEVADEWVAPPIVVDWFRPSLRIGGAMEHLNRVDLSVDLYRYLWARASLRLGLQFGEGLYIAAGGGLQIDDSKIISQTGGPVLPASARTRLFYELSVAINFEPKQLRSDKRHTLTLETRLFTSMAVVQNEFEYQKIFEYGDNSLQVYGRYVDVRGHNGRWYDQPTISSRAYKNPATSQEFSDIIPQVGAEFHFSVLRQYLLVSGFAGISGYVANKDSVAGNQNLSFQLSAGPGIHSLILDAFMLDVYYAISFAGNGDRNSAVVLDFRKVY